MTYRKMKNSNNQFGNVGRDVTFGNKTTTKVDVPVNKVKKNYTPLIIIGYLLMVAGLLYSLTLFPVVEVSIIFVLVIVGYTVIVGKFNKPFGDFLKSYLPFI